MNRRQLLKARILLLLVATLLCPGIATDQARGATLTYLLDDFESGLRIVQPQTTGNLKNIWGFSCDGCTGTTSITTSEQHDGTHALDSYFQSGDDWQAHFYTYTENLPGWPNGWNLVSKLANNPSMNPAGGTPAWELNKVNRLRFWIKFDNPSFAPSSNPNSHNLEFGTFIRCPTCTGQESDNNHWYHFLNLGYTGGVWQQVIIDTHPDHIRSANGNQEWPDQIHLYGPGYTYFDLMTRFYIDVPYGALPVGTHVYLDGFEFYQETNNENVDQIRSLTAAYVPATNEIRVSWRGRKDQDTIQHEVRYSFSDIFASGWAGATPAPNGMVGPACCGGDNGMVYQTNAINLSAGSVIYLAIKPQNSDLFRQIAIPVSSSASISLPRAPSNLVVY